MSWEDGLNAKPERPRAPAPAHRPRERSRSGDVNPYAAGALESAVQEIASAPEGTRNDTLNRNAFGLGGLIATGALDESDVTRALEDAARWGEPSCAEHDRRKIADGIRAGKGEPRDIPPPKYQTNGSGHQVNADGEPPPDDGPEPTDDDDPRAPPKGQRTDGPREYSKAEGSGPAKPPEPVPLVTLGSLLGPAIETAERRRTGDEKPVPLLFREHAEILGGGLWPGAHPFIAGTGVGKSTFWFQNALNAAKLGCPVCYIGLELNELAVALRVLGEDTGISWSGLYTGRSKAGHIDRIRVAAPAIEGLPFYVEFGDASGWAPSRLVQRVEAMRQKHPTGPLLVVLDFLQIVGDEPSDGGKGRELRERIGRAAYAATHAGNKYGASVVLVSSAARDKYGLLASAADSAGLVSRKAPGKIEPVRTILNPEPLIGVGKESGEVEYSAESQSVLLRWPMPLESGETAVILAVPKLRYGAKGWFAMSFWQRFAPLPVKDTGELPEVPSPGGKAVDDDEIAARLLETIRKHPEFKSKDAVASATRGRKGRNLKALAEMLADERIEITKEGCRVCE